MISTILHIYTKNFIDRMFLLFQKKHRWYHWHTNIRILTKYQERVELIQIKGNSLIILRINNRFYTAKNWDVDPLEYGATLHEGSLAIQEAMKNAREYYNQ